MEEELPMYDMKEVILLSNGMIIEGDGIVFI
jgi:hypothetical protein